MSYKIVQTVKGKNLNWWHVHRVAKKNNILKYPKKRTASGIAPAYPNFRQLRVLEFVYYYCSTGPQLNILLIIMADRKIMERAIYNCGIALLKLKKQNMVKDE